VTGRRGRRRQQLLDDLNEKRGCSKWKENALDRTLWGLRFGRGYEPVVRQAAECMRSGLSHLCTQGCIIFMTSVTKPSHTHRMLPNPRIC
jgi:hypothetical protein